MKQIGHGILQFFDGIFMCYWGINTFELIAIIGSGQITSLTSNIESVIKIAFSLIGLIYTVFRLLKEYENWQLDKQIKKEDIVEKKLKNKDLESHFKQ